MDDKDKKTLPALGGYTTDTSRYNDIIGLPHHVSAKHAHMSLGDRAAQFSPFSALVGLDEAMDDKAADVLARMTAEDLVEIDSI